MKRIVKKSAKQSNRDLIKPSTEQEDKFNILYHDLRNSFSAIRFATYFLEMKTLTQADREQYLSILDHNLTSAELMIGTLLALSQQKAEEKSMVNPAEVAGLVRHLHAQLPPSVPSECQDKLDRLRQMIEGFL